MHCNPITLLCLSEKDSPDEGLPAGLQVADAVGTELASHRAARACTKPTKGMLEEVEFDTRHPIPCTHKLPFKPSSGPTDFVARVSQPDLVVVLVKLITGGRALHIHRSGRRSDTASEIARALPRRCVIECLRLYVPNWVVAYEYETCSHLPAGMSHSKGHLGREHGCQQVEPHVCCRTWNIKQSEMHISASVLPALTF
jgi:hypothetical protein